MSRSLTRRLTVLTAVGGCLAAATLPALADHDPNHREVTVTAVSSGGGRTFSVLESGADTDLTSLTFNGNGEQPFRVVVKDVDKGLDGGFEVSASMTNLYYWDPVAQKHDYEAMIPSRKLALAYHPTNPLSANGLVVPVLPQVDVSGTLRACTDPTVAGILQIPLLGDLAALLKLLSGAERVICEALGQGGLQVDIRLTEAQPLPLNVPEATTLLGLADLPVSLAGSQQAGAFSQPSYRGAIAAPAAPETPEPATTKRVMTGRPQVSQTLLATLNTALETAVGTVYGTADSLVSESEVLQGVAGISPSLVTGLRELTDQTKVTRLLAPLTSTLGIEDLVDLDALSLSTITGDYTARPVLRANTTAARPGTYEGTLTVDFFDGVK